MTAPKPLPRVDYPTDRAAIAAGYRHIADLIETGAAPIPVGPRVSLFLTDVPVDEQPAAARELMRALGGGRFDKDPDTSSGSLILRGTCGQLPVDIWVRRDAVCERVVTGTREVVDEVRVGEDVRPVETVTRVVEDVEWVCSPLLGAAEVSA